MTLLQSTPEIRALDVDAFRLELKALEDNEQGITYLDTHRHSPPTTIGGVQLDRVVEIINHYTLTLEDGSYRVDPTGANHNLLDVLNYNSVQMTSANSVGRTIVEGGGLTDLERSMLYELYKVSGLSAGDPTFIPAGAGTITVGDDIEIEVTGDCDTGHTLTRQ